MRRHLKKIAVLTIITSMIVGSMAGCGKSGSGEGKVAEIKIGSIHPLTGSMAYEGQALVNAQQIAIDEINEAGGIKSKIGRAHV